MDTALAIPAREQTTSGRVGSSGPTAGAAGSGSGGDTDGGSADGVAPTAQNGFIAALISLLAAGAEAAIFYGRYIYQLPYYWLLAGHLVVLALLGVWIYAITRRNGDASFALLTTLAVAAMGPLGGLVGAVASISTPVRHETTPLLRAWYERISHSIRVDPVTKHCDMVAIGRALDLAGDVPPSFSEAIDKGTLLQKQNALGMIARKFHPNYLTALKAALKSSEPVIRVQAAAVAAHVRDDLKDLLHRLLDELRLLQANSGGAATSGEKLSDTSDSGDAQLATAQLATAWDVRSGLRLIAQIEQCLSSGLLDEKDRSVGLQLVKELSLEILDEMETVGDTVNGIDQLLDSDLDIESVYSGPQRAIETDDWAIDAIYAQQLAFDRERDSAALKLNYERLLLRHGRFDRFAARRHNIAGLASGLWRVRRLGEVHP